MEELKTPYLFVTVPLFVSFLSGMFTWNIDDILWLLGACMIYGAYKMGKIIYAK